MPDLVRKIKRVDILRIDQAPCIIVLKRIWGALMAKLIRTGEMVAIDLKHLHSADLLYLDDEIEATMTGCHSNGTFN